MWSNSKKAQIVNACTSYFGVLHQLNLYSSGLDGWLQQIKGPYYLYSCIVVWFDGRAVDSFCWFISHRLMIIRLDLWRINQRWFGFGRRNVRENYIRLLGLRTTYRHVKAIIKQGLVSLPEQALPKLNRASARHDGILYFRWHPMVSYPKPARLFGVRMNDVYDSFENGNGKQYFI